MRERSQRRWHPEEIERLTRQRLDEYQTNTGHSISWPWVPIELVIENEPFDLLIKWEAIEAQPGETILGALRPEERQIVLNEHHQDLFEEKPGLERFTLGHELGHWDLFCSEQRSVEHLLPGIDTQYEPAYRNSAHGVVQVLMTMTESKEEAYSIFRELQSNPRRDTPIERRAVDRYSAALLMPKEIVEQEIRNLDLTHWKAVYYLAKRFGVTATACKVRLEELRHIFIKDGKIFRSREQYSGQMMLNF